jgi:hypothetical protein
MSALPIVRDGDYTFTSAGFVIKGHKREKPARLNALLFPSFMSNMAEIEAHRSGDPAKIARAEQERQERQRLINRKWAVSQLMHYGIPLVDGQDKIQVLRDAVKAGLVSDNSSAASAASGRSLTDRSQSAIRFQTRSPALCVD